MHRTNGHLTCNSRRIFDTRSANATSVGCQIWCKDECLNEMIMVAVMNADGEV